MRVPTVLEWLNVRKMRKMVEKINTVGKSALARWVKVRSQESVRKKIKKIYSYCFSVFRFFRFLFLLHSNFRRHFFKNEIGKKSFFYFFFRKKLETIEPERNTTYVRAH
jgi:hypothetical protein